MLRPCQGCFKGHSDEAQKGARGCPCCTSRNSCTYAQAIRQGTQSSPGTSCFAGDSITQSSSPLDPTRILHTATLPKGSYTTSWGSIGIHSWPTYIAWSVRLSCVLLELAKSRTQSCQAELSRHIGKLKRHARSHPHAPPVAVNQDMEHPDLMNLREQNLSVGPQLVPGHTHSDTYQVNTVIPSK